MSREEFEKITNIYEAGKKEIIDQDQEAANKENIDRDHEKANEDNKAFDKVKVAQAEKEAVQLAEVRARLNGDSEEAATVGAVEGSVVENIRPSTEKIEDNPTFNELVAAYGKMNGPGSHNPEVVKKWTELSSEIASKVNDISDMKEAAFYLTSEDKDAVNKRWDGLSREEVESATSEEEMRNALRNIRAGGFEEPMRLKKIATDRYPSLGNARG